MMESIRLLRQDFRRGLSKRFVLAVLLVGVSILLDNIDMAKSIGREYGPSVYYFLFFSFSFGGLYCRYLFAMLCVLPYSTGFLEDYESYYLLYSAGRAPKQDYLLSKFMSSSIISGLTAGLGVALFIAVLSIWCPPIRAEEVDPTDLYLAKVTVENGLSYYLYLIVYSFLTGCLWGAVATCISLYVRSIYFTVASPFIASFCLSHGLKLLRIPNEYRLDMWLGMRSILFSENITLLMATGVVTVIVALLGVIFIRKGGRLIEDK